MAKGRKGSVIQSKLNMIIYGKQFTGKSTLASQLCYFKREDGTPFRVLYIDPESGSIDDYLEDMENNGVNLDNLYILYTQSLQEVREYIKKVKNGEDFYVLDEDGNETEDIVMDADGKPFRADAIVVDGTSLLNLVTKQGLVELSKKRNAVKAKNAGLVGDERFVKVEGAGLEWKDYQTVNFKGQDLILDLTASGVHWIATARETTEKETVKDKDGNSVSVSTGVKIPEGFKELEYNAKTVIRMSRDEKTGAVYAHVEKDRTHCHEDNVLLEDPSLLDWQSVIDKGKGKKSYIIKNDLSHSVKTEQKLYEKELSSFVDDEPTSSESTSNKTDELTELKDNITNKMKGFSPPEKSSVTKALKEKGLPATPTAVKSESDISVLKEILSVISK